LFEADVVFVDETLRVKAVTSSVIHSIDSEGVKRSLRHASQADGAGFVLPEHFDMRWFLHRLVRPPAKHYSSRGLHRNMKLGDLWRSRFGEFFPSSCHERMLPKINASVNSETHGIAVCQSARVLFGIWQPTIR
jgi:hypothetical protein